MNISNLYDVRIVSKKTFYMGGILSGRFCLGGMLERGLKLGGGGGV